MTAAQIKLVRLCIFNFNCPPAELHGLRLEFIERLCYLRSASNERLMAKALECPETDEERELVMAVLAEFNL